MPATLLGNLKPGGVPARCPGPASSLLTGAPAASESNAEPDAEGAPLLCCKPAEGFLGSAWAGGLPESGPRTCGYELRVRRGRV